MKYAFVFVGLILSLTLNAKTMTSANGSGYGSGWCDGNSGYFCIDGIKQQARRDALSRADLDCRIRNGRTQPSYTARCGFEFCNPSSLPMNAPNQMISCRSDCSIDCEIGE